MILKNSNDTFSCKILTKWDSLELIHIINKISFDGDLHLIYPFQLNGMILFLILKYFILIIKLTLFLDNISRRRLMKHLSFFISLF